MSGMAPGPSLALFGILRGTLRVYFWVYFRIMDGVWIVLRTSWGHFFKSFVGAWSLLGTTSDRRPPQYCFTPPRAQWAEVYSKYSGRTANGAMCTLGAAHRDSKVEGRVTLTPTPPTCTVIPLMHASTHNHIWKSMDSYR